VGVTTGGDAPHTVDVTLRPWSDGDLDLLFRGNAADMTEHLGGPESDDAVNKRHKNYLRFWREGSARMFTILVDGEPVGGIGWWYSQWRDNDVQETGWFVVPEAQGRGIAQSAVGLIIHDARKNGTKRLLTAYPSVTNGASNALCERSGFRLLDEETFEFRGTTLTSNVWVLDLRPEGG
jgi:RimJ/RimL family protein N-acetyltransferase